MLSVKKQAAERNSTTLLKKAQKHAKPKNICLQTYELKP